MPLLKKKAPAPKTQYLPSIAFFWQRQQGLPEDIALAKRLKYLQSIFKAITMSSARLYAHADSVDEVVHI